MIASRSVFIAMRPEEQPNFSGVAQGVLFFASTRVRMCLCRRVGSMPGARAAAELARSLLREVPTLGSYLLSFWVLGLLRHRRNKRYRCFHHVPF
jgi:hypothetical protein